jgi:hypothetical protein
MAADPDVDIETRGTRTVYESRWMRVREDSIRRRDGSEGIYGILEKPDFVVIVPLEEDRRIPLVQQYRYPCRSPILGVSAGFVGANARRRSG